MFLICVFIILAFYIKDSAHDSKIEEQKRNEIINKKVERVINHAENKTYEVYINNVSAGFATNSYLEYTAYKHQYSENEILKDKDKKLKPIYLLAENSKEVEKILIPKTNEKLKIKALKLNADKILIYEVDNYKLSDKKLSEIVKEIYKFE